MKYTCGTDVMDNDVVYLEMPTVWYLHQLKLVKPDSEEALAHNLPRGGVVIHDEEKLVYVAEQVHEKIHFIRRTSFFEGRMRYICGTEVKNGDLVRVRFDREWMCVLHIIEAGTEDAGWCNLPMGGIAVTGLKGESLFVTGADAIDEDIVFVRRACRQASLRYASGIEAQEGDVVTVQDGKTLKRSCIVRILAPGTGNKDPWFDPYVHVRISCKGRTLFRAAAMDESIVFVRRTRCASTRPLAKVRMACADGRKGRAQNPQCDEVDSMSMRV